VILAGGRGTRLRPYTTSFPKPLMPVGDRPILEILVGQLARAGFSQLIVAVGHLAGLIEAYFGDGSRFGVHITYAREDEPLGTVGPLRALDDRLPEHFLVANGDVLCDVDLTAFLNEHAHAAPARDLSIATVQRRVHSEYGVIECGADGIVCGYLEKPTFPLRVSTGIYAFSRTALELIPKGARMDFPDLVLKLLRHGCRVVTHDHSGLWLDIGRADDYEAAQQLIAEQPNRFETVMTRSESKVPSSQSPKREVTL
jgi:NDP-sugar pyrophosphorylase family protein